MSLPVTRESRTDHEKVADKLTRPKLRDLLLPGEQPKATVVGAVAALWSVGAGTLLGTVAAWAVRTVAGDPTNPLATFGSGLAGWLYAHSAGVSSAAGRIALVPMGFQLVLGWLVFRGVRSAVYGASLTRRRALVAATAAATVMYTVFAGLAVLTVRLLDGPRVGGWPAVAGAFVLSSVIAPLGAAAGSGRRPRDVVAWLVQRSRESEPGASTMAYARSAARAGLAALGTLLAGGALLFAYAQLTHLGRSGPLFEGLTDGIGDLVSMLVLCLALVPNAVVFGLSYAVGTGFAVGNDTAVTPWITDLGAIPAIPVLGALPDPGVPPRATALVLLIPLIAGAAAGAVIARRHPAITLRSGAFTAVVTGGTVGCAVFVLTLLAGGPLGSGRLATVGPSPWRTAAAAGIEVALVAASVITVRWVIRDRRAHRG